MQFIYYFMQFIYYFMQFIYYFNIIMKFIILQNSDVQDKKLSSLDFNPWTLKKFQIDCILRKKQMRLCQITTCAQVCEMFHTQNKSGV